MLPCVRRTMALAVLAAGGCLAQDLTGIWQGTVINPDTKQELRTVLKIASPEGDLIKANFYSIDQTYLVFPATLTLKNSVVKMSIPGIAATYEGKLTADGNAINGTVKGFSVPTQWNMKRVSPEQAWAIPKPPAQPKPLASPDPSFEVVTVKPSDPNPQDRGGRRSVRGGDVSLHNLTAMTLLTGAYNVQPHQVIGAPAWVNDDKWDIAGKAEGEGQPTDDQLKVMLGKVLADRFQLAAHKEQREMPVYVLTAAKGGAKISRNTGENNTQGAIQRGPGDMLLNNLSMDDFARILQSGVVDRPVINQTGLEGTYDFSLIWTPEQAAIAAPNVNALAPVDKAEPPPDVFTAVQQQLGLKLEAKKMMIEVLVVDKMEKPSGN